MRVDGENALAQSEREREALSQALSSIQQESQQALRIAITDHQEEAERLIAEKVGGWRCSDCRIIIFLTFI